MSVEMTAQTAVTCKTVHDYIASQNTSDVEAVDMTRAVRGNRPNSGSLYFIPASTPEADRVFDEGAKIGPEQMLRILHEMISSAAEQYDCECVVIDCGPIIDPYTATAATLSDRAFIIGQNEAISFSSLKTYPDKIREFHPQFTTANMKVIINKVRGWEMLEQRRLQEDIFAAIPFTMDIVDVSEGLQSTGDMQMMIFEDHITQIVEKVFNVDRPDLIPDRSSSLPEEWNGLVENAHQLEHAPKLNRLKKLRLLLPIGLLAIIVGGGLFYAASAERHRAQNAARAAELVSVLETAVTDAAPEQQESLQEALALANALDPADDDGLSAALDAALAAGLDNLPEVQRLDASQENAGIATLLVGAVMAAVGFASGKSRKTYLNAIQGLKRGGAEWLMEQLKGKRSARKMFDGLLKMSQA
jgi:MinD-like ATPase involved in chromosome partitioning or flagellar assembly